MPNCVNAKKAMIENKSIIDILFPSTEWLIPMAQDLENKETSDWTFKKLLIALEIGLKDQEQNLQKNAPEVYQKYLQESAEIKLELQNPDIQPKRKMNAFFKLSNIIDNLVLENYVLAKSEEIKEKHPEIYQKYW